MKFAEEFTGTQIFAFDQDYEVEAELQRRSGAILVGDITVWFLGDRKDASGVRIRINITSAIADHQIDTIRCKIADAFLDRAANQPKETA